MSPYDCQAPLCRWRHFNGDHPNLPHAVWWGCTPRPPAPLRKGDTVRLKGRPDLEPETVAVIGWDTGRGWRFEISHNGYLSAPHDPADYELAGSHTQPDIYDLLETT